MEIGWGDGPTSVTVNGRKLGRVASVVTVVLSLPALAVAFLAFCVAMVAFVLALPACAVGYALDRARG